MRAGRADRVAGGVLLALAVAAALAAAGFRVAFAADPLGPRALPWVAAALLGGGGFALALRPGGAWGRPDGAASRRIAAAVAVFLVYAPLLPWLGFVPATAALVAGLGRLFGGGPGRVVLAGIGVAVALQVTFAWALGLPLPTGALWDGGR